MITDLDASKRKAKVVEEDVPTKPKTQRKLKTKAKVYVVDEDDDKKNYE